MLSPAALVATFVVVVAHIVFMVLETFLWTTPRGRRIFGQTSEQAEATKVLAQNQGVYNGALAVLLAWAAFAAPSGTVVAVLTFVIVVGIYGAVTAKPTILLLQALPAAVAVALVVLEI